MWRGTRDVHAITRKGNRLGADALPSRAMEALDASSLRALAVRLGVAPPASGATEALLRYGAMVADWRRKTDLVGPAGGERLLEVLFADALLLAGDDSLLPAGAGPLLDVGAGAGAPLVPLLLLRPLLRGVALEPRRRRVTFLRFVQGSLPSLLERLHVVEGRIEPRRPSPPEQVRWALSRATFPPVRWLQLAPRLAPEGILLASRTPDPWPEELLVLARRDYQLPWSGSPRVALRFAPAR